MCGFHINILLNSKGYLNFEVELIELNLHIIIMSLFKFLGRLGFIAIALMLHCSLLFCTDSHCMFPVDENLLIVRASLYIPTEIFSIIPVEIKTIQLLAQWFLIVEAIFVVYFCIKIINKIVILILKITFAVILLAAIYYFYTQNSKDP